MSRKTRLFIATHKVFAKVIALVIIGMALITVSTCGYDGSIPVGENAVIITGECVIINYDATEAEFDAAKVAWLKAIKDHPQEGSGHTKAYY